MILAMVKGTIVSSNKVEKLVGSKLLIVEEWNVETGKGCGRLQVAVDLVGAGAGELVLCTCGSSAYQTEETGRRPVDMAIIGIVDQAGMDGTLRYRKYASESDNKEDKKPEQLPEAKEKAAAPAAESVENVGGVMPASNDPGTPRAGNQLQFRSGKGKRR